MDNYPETSANAPFLDLVSLTLTAARSPLPGDRPSAVLPWPWSQAVSSFGAGLAEIPHGPTKTHESPPMSENIAGSGAVKSSACKFPVGTRTYAKFLRPATGSGAQSNEFARASRSNSQSWTQRATTALDPLKGSTAPELPRRAEWRVRLDGRCARPLPGAADALRGGRKKVERACRPDSVRRCGATVIPLGRRLPGGSSHLPARSSGRSARRHRGADARVPI